jgi:hypothetical protein
MAKEGWMMNIIKLRRSLENDRASLVNKGCVSHTVAFAIYIKK